jgi:hypothetical protein
MYNLNYNVTNARLNRPVGRPFIPTPRFDAYSSSLVLAVPGQVFKSGYYNVFNQTFPWDDISAYIKNSTFNYQTNVYNTALPSHSIALTGSGDWFLADLNDGFTNASFTGSGYETTLCFTGSLAGKVNNDSQLGVGVNLGTGSNWVVECWAAFDVNASYDSASMFGYPNRQIVSKYTPNSPNSSAYLLTAGYSGVNELNFPAPDPDLSGSALGVISWLNGPPVYPSPTPFESIIWPNVGSTTVTSSYQFNHYALSFSATGSGHIYRTYINGTLIAQYTTSTDFGKGGLVNTPLTPTLLFGQTWDTGSNFSGIFIQDFRMYNGTNKNYTGSQFVPPPSMIVGKPEPYPQYT